MPSHITHTIFAEDALRSSLGPDTGSLLRHKNLITLAAQGPDIFYHNQRTRPSGLPFGKLLHHRGYGSFISAFVAEAKKISLKNKLHPLDNPLAAFALGFTTHAVLDRATHPFIIYFSGWVDPKRPETRKYSLCHAFYERILDVFILRDRRNRDIASCDFYSLVDCGPELPQAITGVFLRALSSAFPQVKNIPLNGKKLQNAYLDALNFYRYTNPSAAGNRAIARLLDLSDSSGRRRLALFHPPAVPSGIDFLNERHREWIHPSFADIRSTLSFNDLYSIALDKSVPVLRAVADAFTGGTDPRELEAVVGNENLNDGISTGTPAPSFYSDPLPFPELLESYYKS